MQKYERDEVGVDRVDDNLQSRRELLLGVHEVLYL